MDLWISVLLAIPLAVVANLFTPRIQRALEQRSKMRSERRTAEEVSFQTQLAVFHLNPDSLTQFLVAQLIRIAYFGAIFGVGSGAFFLAGRIRQGGSAFYSAGQLLALIGTLIVLNISRTTYSLYTAATREAVDHRDEGDAR